MNKKHTLKIPGTCWLIAFLNNEESKTSQYNYISINRKIRYNTLLNLIKSNKRVLNKYPYIFENLMGFAGSIFDILDVEDYDYNNFENILTNPHKIMKSNDEMIFNLLEIFQDSNKTQEDYLKGLLNKEKTTNLNVVSVNRKLKNKTKYIFKNYKILYNSEKSFVNINDNNLFENLVDKELKFNRKVYLNIDVSKGVIKDKTLKTNNMVNIKIQRKFISQDNHCLNIIGKCKNGDYIVEDVFEERQTYDKIEKEYLFKNVNHIVVHYQLKCQKTYKIDLIKYIEGEY